MKPIFLNVTLLTELAVSIKESNADINVNGIQLLKDQLLDGKKLADATYVQFDDKTSLVVKGNRADIVAQIQALQ